jgi:hypothetical protein
VTHEESTLGFEHESLKLAHELARTAFANEKTRAFREMVPSPVIGIKRQLWFMSAIPHQEDVSNSLRKAEG